MPKITKPYWKYDEEYEVDEVIHNKVKCKYCKRLVGRDEITNQGCLICEGKFEDVRLGND